MLYSEFNDRCLLCAFSCLEIALGLETEDSGNQAFREHPYRGVVFLGGLVVVSSFSGNPVFGTLKLSLEVTEVFVGFEVRIGL